MAQPGKRLLGIYGRSPVFVQNIMSSAFGLVKWLDERGGLFRRLYRELEETQWWNPERLRELQLERLRAMLRFAQEHVPFYRKRFAEWGVSWEQVHSVADLRRFPIVTREDVHGCRREMVADVAPRSKVLAQTTSGTTGTPIEVLCDRKTYLADKAWAARQRTWGGYDGRSWRATFNGHKIVPVAWNEPPYWRYNFPWRQMHFSVFHMGERQLPSYAKALRAAGVRFLEGYASAIYILARYLNATGQTLPMKAVLTSSEPLLDAYREAIETAFACKVFDYFGLTEKVVSAGECEYHSGLHVAMEHVVAEVAPFENGRGGHEGAAGELIGTSLVNTVMPLIRYRTGDVLDPSPGTCSCGRGLEMIGRARSRSMSIIVCPDGRYLPPTALLAPLRSISTIHESQIVQEEPARVVVRVVRRPDYSREDEAHLLDGFRERLGPTMTVRVEYAQEIQRTAAGKFPLVVSRVSSDLLGASNGAA